MLTAAIVTFLVGAVGAAPFVQVGGIDCDTCKLVVGEAQKFVVKEASAFEADFSELCNILPTNETVECQAFVAKDGAKLVQEIANLLDPTATCKAIKLCSADDTLSVEFIAAQQPKTADPNGTECVVCKDLFTSLVKVLQTPADQQQILQVIETPICDSLGPIRGVCDDLITTYGGDLLTYLAGKIDPVGICTDVDAC
eukprot:m.413044 g.413044  ORF g.413044 m.413044 type:complete len:198 (-) comp29007_c0_seq1:269-862(-)